MFGNGKMGRPRKVRAPGDDGESHRIWDVTDFALYHDGDITRINAERLAWWQRNAQPDMCKKLMIAAEEGEDLGRAHGQVRICFPQPHREPYVRKLMGKSHTEVTFYKDDWSYFNKWGSTLLIDVDHRHQGSRPTFREQKDLITHGATLRECHELAGVNYQVARTAELLIGYHEPARPTADREIHLVESPAAPMPSDVYRLEQDYGHNRWHRYDAHESIYIDQLDLKLSTYRLTKLCGPGGLQVGGRKARWEHVYISGLNEQERVALGFAPRPHRTPWDLIVRS